MEKKELLYEGKGKKLFATENPEILVSEFKDDLTAFNAQKKGSESGKGALNCKISKILFELLQINDSLYLEKLKHCVLNLDNWNSISDDFLSWLSK